MTAIASTVQSFILAKRADGRAARTIEDYHRCLNPFADWCERQGLDTETLDRSDFRRYVVEELRSKGWAKNTVGIHVSVLRCFLSWIHDEGHIDDDLARAVEAPEKTTWVEDPLTPEEIRKLVEACAGDEILDKRDKALILAFLDSGLRLGEMARLERTDVIFEDGGGCAKVWDPKGKEWKPALLGQKAAAALEAYLQRREDDHPALWMGVRGPLTKWGVYRAVKRRARAVGLERVHPHLFRKTFATWWTRNGGDRDRLMTLGGWSSEEMLKIYVLLGSLPELEEAHRKFSPVDRML